MHSALQKRYIRMALWLLRKKLGECASAESIKNDNANSGNKAFALVDSILIESSDKIKEGYQRRMIQDLGGLFIWILRRDTGYKDYGIYFLNEILEHKEELQKALKPYLKPPHKWYPNVWWTTKEDSKKGKKKGTVAKHGKSFTEKIFTPAEQELTQSKLGKLNKRRK